MSISETVEESSELFESLAKSAQGYAELGYRVLPCQPDADTVPNDRRKAPFGKSVPHGVKDASNDVETVEGWWTKEPTCNVGIAGGNGLIVIDVDVKKGKDGVADINRIFADAGEPSPIDSGSCPMAKTPSGGYHLFYRCENASDYGNDVEIAYQDKKMAIDIRADGGYVVAFPSTISTGDNVMAYQWGRPLVPIANLPELPACLKKVLDEQNDKPQPDFRDRITTPIPNTGISATDRMRRVYAYLNETEPAIEHQNGHTSLYTALGRVSWGFDLNEDETRQAAKYLNDTRCEPKFEPEALDHKIKDAMTTWHNHQGKPRGHLWTESRRNSVPEVDAGFDRMIENLRANAAAKRKAASTQQETPAMSENDDNQPLGIPFDDLHKDGDFPVEAFPSEVVRFINETAAAIQRPPESIACVLLPTIAGAISTKRNIRLKRSHVEPSSIWSILVAPTGERKTAIMESVVDLINDRDMDADDQYKKDCAAYKAKDVQYRKDKKAYDIWLDSWMKEHVHLHGEDSVVTDDPFEYDSEPGGEGWAENDGSKDSEKQPEMEEPVKPIPPINKSFIVGNTTVEGAREKMKSNNGGLLIVTDEFRGFIGCFNQYNNGKDVDESFWLQTYNGKSYKSTRKSDGDCNIRKMCASVVGGLQTEFLYHDIVDEKKFQNSGFLARFFVLEMPRLTSCWTDDDVSTDAIKGMQSMLYRVMDMKWDETEDDNGEKRYNTITVDITDRARKLFIADANFYDRWKQSRPVGDAFAGTIAKLFGRSARIALALHCLKGEPRAVEDVEQRVELHRISEETARAAIRINFWFAYELFLIFFGKKVNRDQYEKMREAEKAFLEVVRNCGGIPKIWIKRAFDLTADEKQIAKSLLSRGLLVENNRRMPSGQSAKFLVVAE